MTQPDPIRTHRLDDRPLPAWLDGYHHHDAGELVVHTPDGDAPARDGWTLVGWSDGSVTVASPTTAARVYGPDGIAGRLQQAEDEITELQHRHEARGQRMQHRNQQLDQAEATVQRVTALYEQWLQAGPPPLGTSTARWWDKRLAELHRAIQPAAEQSRTTVNNAATSKDPA